MTPRDLIAAFEVLADAPDGVKRLRELVLQLAVRGKLVPQDPADEPASALVERTAVELARNGGRTRATRRAAPSDQVGIFRFDIPRNWIWTTVEECTSYVRRGKSPVYDEGGTTPVVSQKCVQWGGFDLSRARRIADDSVGRYDDEQLLRAGDLLWNSTGLGTLGRVVEYRADSQYGRVVADSHVTIVRAYGCDARYLWCWFAGPIVQGVINELATGTTKQTELATKTIESLPVPLAPLAEQRRIVARVDELMDLLDRLEAARTARDDLRRAARDAALAALRDAEDADEVEAAWGRIGVQMEALFTNPGDVESLRDVILQLAMRGRLVSQDAEEGTGQHALMRLSAEAERLARQKLIRSRRPAEAVGESERPFRVPETWTWTRLQSVGDWGAGATPLRAESRYFGGSLNWFKSGELPDGPMRFASEETITEEALAQCSLRENRPGDVLIAMYGATIGKLGILEVPGTTNQAVCACTCFDGFYNRFLFLVLLAWRNVFRANSEGAAQPNISKVKIVTTPIPVPALLEQHRIVAKVDELFALCDAFQARHTAARDLHRQFAAAAVHHFDLEVAEGSHEPHMVLDHADRDARPDHRTVGSL